MAILIINTGSMANAGNGDSLRTAFNKVNTNFAYLGSSGARGLIGFTGSQGITGYWGSAGYIGSQGYTGSSGTAGNSLVNGTSTVSLSTIGLLTVPGSIIPNANVVYDLGSPTAKFRSLYISTSTIFIGTGTIGISETGQMLVNGNDAVSKLEYFGGEGVGPRDAGYIAWNTTTFTFNIPGKELLTAIYDLKPGNKIRAVNPNVSLDREFTIVGNARQYTRGFSNEYLMAAIDVAETTSTNVYAYSLYLPVKDKSATLANGTWTVSLSALGGLVFPDASVQTKAYTGIPGPYANDAASATAGVAVGGLYHKTGTSGQVFVRLA